MVWYLILPHQTRENKGDSIQSKKSVAQNVAMNSRSILKLDWCSYQAAKYAVEHWHYSKIMTWGKTARIGVWENSIFVGAIIFSRGACFNLGVPYNLTQDKICELVRIALNKHQTPVSRILSIALKILRKEFPSMKLVVSYADSSQGHHGGIYQANGWIYVGCKGYPHFRINGKIRHSRQINENLKGYHNKIEWLRKNVDPNAEIVRTGAKYKYLMPLDSDTKKTIQHMRKPYPKRAESIDSDATANQAEEGGASPTSALQLSDGEDNGTQ